MQIYFLMIKPLIQYTKVFPMKHLKLGMAMPLPKKYNIEYSLSHLS